MYVPLRYVGAYVGGVNRWLRPRPAALAVVTMPAVRRAAVAAMAAAARAVAVVFVEYLCATIEFANVTHLLGLRWASGPHLPQRTLAGS
jgi:hypothetical protein